MIPASIRNRNPGAQYPGPSAKKFGGDKYETLRSKDGTHKIASFPTDIHGGAALFHLLHEGREPVTRKLRYRDRPLRQAIETWCGAYHLPTYIKVLTQHTGLTETDVLTADLLRDPSRAIPLAKAMALQEAGQAYPMQDGGWLRAHEMAFGEAQAPAWTPKNDVPTRNPEDKLDDLKWKTIVALGLTSATGSAASAIAPDPVMQSIAAFEQLGAKLVTLATPQGMTILGLGAGAYFVATWALPRLGLGK